MHDYPCSVALAGSESDLAALEAAAAENGVESELRGLAINSADVVSRYSELVLASTSIMAISRVVIAYIRSRQKRLIIMDHEGRKFALENPTDEQLDKAMQTAEKIFIEDTPQ